MSSDNNLERGFSAGRLLSWGASLVILIAGLRAAQSVLVPIVFAVFIAVLGAGPMLWLKRHRVPKILAVLIVALTIIAVISGIGVLLGTSVNEFTAELPKYRESLNETFASLLDYLNGRGLDVSFATLFSLEPGAVMEVLGVTLKRLVGALSSSVMVTILVIFMLFEAADFHAKIKLASSGGAIDFRRVEAMSIEIQRYLGIKTITSAVTGITVGIWVSIMGVDFPLLWAFIAFLLNYIPFIGSIIASVPAIMLSIVVHGIPGAGLLAIGYVVINVGISNFLEPILMGRKLGLSPLVVLLSLVCWGWVWGPVGMLMSVPLTMTAKILLEHSKEFRWIAVLMEMGGKEKV
ncbi:MAG: AI-2E family transporter [Bdellovibrionales bacterium]|nr:AI-2E family transporter [Bdellovibrionales bacterium]